MVGIGHNRSRNQKRQQVLDDLFVLAFTAESEEVQLAATVAWLNRFEGKPVAMSAQASNVDPLTSRTHSRK